MKGSTTVTRGRENEWACSTNGPLTTQIDEFDVNDGDELEENRVNKNIVGGAKRLVHIRLEP